MNLEQPSEFRKVKTVTTAGIRSVIDNEQICGAVTAYEDQPEFHTGCALNKGHNGPHSNGDYSWWDGLQHDATLMVRELTALRAIHKRLVEALDVCRKRMVDDGYHSDEVEMADDALAEAKKLEGK